MLFEAGNCCGFQRDPKESKIFDEEWAHIQKEFPKDIFHRWNTMDNMAKFNKEQSIVKLMSKSGKGVLPVLIIEEKVIMIEKYPTFFELRETLQEMN